MLTRPALRQDFTLHALPGEGYILLSDQESFALEGPAAGAVLPLVDGNRTTAEIVTELSGILPEDQVLWTIDYLDRAGHLRQADRSVAPDEAVFWYALGMDARGARDRLDALPVEIVTTGAARYGPGARMAAEGLVALGAVLVDDGAVRLVVAGDMLDPELAEVDARARGTGRPWLLVRPGGIRPSVGPLFVPGQTGCWHCLRSRLLDMRDVEAMLSRRLGLGAPPPRPLPWSGAFAAQALSTAGAQLVRYLLASRNPEIEGVVQRLDPMGLMRDAHVLTRRPQCPACGDPEIGRIGGAPTSFRSRGVARGVENGERAEPAEEILARHMRHVSPITGIVRKLIPSQWNGRTPLLSYSAGNNLAVAPVGLSGVKGNLRSFSSGKGRTDVQARTSALCEALERYSGKFRGEEIVLPGTLRDLADAALHPNEVMLYSEAQYRDRAAWNARGSQFQVVPDWLEETERVDWTPVWSVTQRRMRYLPSSLLFYGYPTPYTGRFTSWADSNGAAAGASYEDAVLQGLFELVERDAVAVWWYNRLPRPAVDVDALDDPFLQEMRAWFEGIGREFWVLDLTTDVGIPAYVCINRRVSSPTEDIVMGFGAHGDARLAVMRAVTEMNQFMPAVLDVAPNGETQYAFDDPECLAWWRGATLANQPYLRPAPGGTVGLRPSPAPWDEGARAGGDIRDALRGAIAAVEAVVPEVMVLDQTRADVVLPVVKVIAPGLRHFWARLGPGRLYDVPVAAGELSAPTPEAELNPIAMFL